MTKKFYIVVLVMAMTFAGCGQQKEYNKEIKTITVDTSTAEPKLDISEMFDLSGVEIIKLETNDDCLVSSQGNILLTDDHIIIGDRMTKRISLFNRDGSFVRNIGASGRGPGEYIQLGGFTVVNDSIYVQDAAQAKVVVYPLTGKGFREMHLNPPIYHVDLFSNNDRLYFVTNYVSTEAKKRYYSNLVGMDMKSGDRDYYIPFNPEIEEKHQAWGLNKYSSTNGNETLVIFGRNDTIYQVSNDNIRAQYVVDFVYNKIPESLLQQDAARAFTGALDNGYNTGLDKIFNLPEYILGEFSEGTEIYRMVYDKLRDEILVGKSVVINGMGELQILDFHATDNNELILVYDVYVLKDLWEYVVSKKEFADAALKEALKEAIESSDDDDNPIVMIAKLK
jgi:hypothetical protein